MTDDAAPDAEPDAPSEPSARAAALRGIAAEIVGCRLNPRLVAWREEAAAHPPARFAGQPYWAKPLPGFGDLAARVLVVGLAPAAHGGNRTGRIFTGDRSGDFLFASLYRTGFASQPTSVAADDGLTQLDLYVAAINRCAPPDNRPTPAERDTCLPYLIRELRVLTDVRAVVALGAFAWDGFLLAAGASGVDGVAVPRPKPRFRHAAEVDLGRWRLIGSFHPSQQNTFTGRLREPMLDAVFIRARQASGLPTGPPLNLSA